MNEDDFQYDLRELRNALGNFNAYSSDINHPQYIAMMQIVVAAEQLLRTCYGEER